MYYNQQASMTEINLRGEGLQLSISTHWYYNPGMFQISIAKNAAPSNPQCRPYVRKAWLTIHLTPPNFFSRVHADWLTASRSLYPTRQLQRLRFNHFLDIMQGGWLLVPMSECHIRHKSARGENYHAIPRGGFAEIEQDAFHQDGM